MRKLILTFVILFLPAGFSDAPEWRVNRETSRIAFSGLQAGTAFEGSFPAYETEIRFDPEKPGVSEVRIVLDMKSAVTGNDDRDAMLLGPDWFETEIYPRGVFAVQSFRHIEGEHYVAEAILTLRDKAKTVTLPFTLTIAESKAYVTGQLTLDRRDFGIGRGPQWETDQWVGYPVAVAIEIEAERMR